MKRAFRIFFGLVLDALVVAAFLTTPSTATARAALTITPSTHSAATRAGEQFSYTARIESSSLAPEVVRVDMDVPQAVSKADALIGRCATLAFRTSCYVVVSAATPGVIVLVATGRACPTDQWAHVHVKNARGDAAVQSIGLRSLNCQ